MNNQYKSHSILMIIGWLILISPATAKTLYQERVEQTEVSDKALKKSLEQVKKHKKIDIIDDLSVPPFHKRAALLTTKKQPFCMTCHLPLPHQKNERNRTFMNMHSHYIACETCHFRPEKTTLAYHWLAYDGIEAGNMLAPRRALEIINKSPIQTERKHKAQFKERTPLAPQPGARISPFYNDRPILLFKENSFAQKIKTEWKNSDENQRAEIKARLHAPLKQEGPSCEKCHGKDKTMFDLEALGATPMQIKAIQNNIIVRFFDRFKKEDDRIRINKLLQ